MIDLQTLWLVLVFVLSWIIGGSVCFALNEDKINVIGAFIGWSIVTLAPPSLIVLIIWLVS